MKLHFNCCYSFYSLTKAAAPANDGKPLSEYRLRHPLCVLFLYVICVGKNHFENVENYRMGAITIKSSFFFAILNKCIFISFEFYVESMPEWSYASLSLFLLNLQVKNEVETLLFRTGNRTDNWFHERLRGKLLEDISHWVAVLTILVNRYSRTFDSQ